MVTLSVILLLFGVAKGRYNMSPNYTLERIYCLSQFGGIFPFHFTDKEVYTTSCNLSPLLFILSVVS